jgi:hypothetical protein
MAKLAPNELKSLAVFITENLHRDELVEDVSGEYNYDVENTVHRTLKDFFRLIKK